MFEKVSQLLKYDLKIVVVHKHIFIHIIWTPTPITLPPARTVHAG